MLCNLSLIRIELKSGKTTETASYNTASVPALTRENLSRFLTVGYQRDSSGVSDVRKASIKIQREFLSFSDCIKHIEVTGKLKKSTTSTSSKTSSKTSTTSRRPPSRVPGTAPPPHSWIPFGGGRKPGETGSEVTRLWRHLGARADSQASPGQITTVRPPARRPSSTTGGSGGSGGWGYRETNSTVFTSTDLQSGLAPALAPSPFTANLLRMKVASPARGASTPTVKVSPPFSGSSVEIVVPVSACQQFLFEIKIISPNNGVVGTVADIELPRLPDIPDFVPPLMTSVLDVKFLMGGSHDLTVKSNSPIPDSCLLDYLEAVDAFNHRVEIIANQREETNAGLKRLQDAVQDEVEMTQAESLKLHGCVCTSPRLEITGDSEVGGVYLYQGLDSKRRPTYSLDLEQRSLPPQSQPRPVSLNRKKRFIGRVDGGGEVSTTTPRNWMAPGGSGGFSHSRPSSSSSNSKTLGMIMIMIVPGPQP